MKLTILGCHSATPRTSGYTTSQVIQTRGHLFLIDCGEGTQVQLRRNKVKFNQIKHIFISHLHGDHFFGLIGLISTFRLLKRENDLHIYGPKGISDENFLVLFNKLGTTKINAIMDELNITNGIEIHPNQKPITASSLASPKPMPSLFLTCL